MNKLSISLVSRIGIIILLIISICTTVKGQEYYLFAGTYTNTTSKGIYVYRFDATTGSMKLISTTENIQNPSYLAVSPNGKYLYSVNENGGEEPGEISAFAFDDQTGSLKFLNKQPSGGDHPCYISVDSSGKWVVVANYSGGNLSVFPLREDGTLGDVAQLINHSGKSVNARRQERPHVHAVEFSRDNNFLFVTDLGVDKTFIYPFISTLAKPLGEENVSFVPSAPGSGPRHITQHPSKPFVYIIQELSGTVTACRWVEGKLIPFQTISSHPATYTGRKEVLTSIYRPMANFLYASNRGKANLLAIYQINQLDGTIALKGFQSTIGETPRNFVIDPTGNYPLVANQNTDNVVIFKRDKETGMLTETGQQISIPKPVCLKFQY